MGELAPMAILSEIFTNKSKEVIENIIRIVEENVETHVSREEKLETMINLLTESGNSGDANEIERNDLLDEAAGFRDDEADDSVSNTLRKLVDMFPDADPKYLEKKAMELASDNIRLEVFIENNLENKDYPKLEDYLRTKNEKLEMDKYLSQFKLFQFLLEYPDPITYFNDTNREHALSNSDEEEVEFALMCLCNQFPLITESNIKKIFKKSNKNIMKSYNKLKTLPPTFIRPRNTIPLPDVPIKNMILLHEIAFIQHEKELLAMKKEKELSLIEARELGLLESCNCCCADDLIPEDCFPCKNGCMFCRECIRKAGEIANAEGETKLLCLSRCGTDYHLSVLQMILSPKTFTNLCHKIQMQEVNEAGIDGLEHCPLCVSFAMIPDPQDQIFHCDNCHKDSCRSCKHEAHVPLRCNEVEYDEDVKMRTFIEDKMTEALLRKCYKCGKTFIKNSGCNKITCSCGAKMCYICRSPITDYSHFNENGCPLHTNDNEIHKQNVITGAHAAKVELGVDKNPNMLKFDPTRDLQDI